MKVIQETPKRARLEFQRDGIILSILRDMPGRKRWSPQGVFLFELTAANIEYLSNRFPDLSWAGIGAAERVSALRQQEVVTLAEQKNDVPLPIGIEAFPFKTAPYDHQLKAFGLSRDAAVFGLFMEMGTGKTKVIIDNAAYLWSSGTIKNLLVVAPNGVHGQWINEQLPIHMPDWVTYSALTYTSNHTKRWLNSFTELMAFDGLRILAMHFDAFNTKKGEDFSKAFLTSADTMWVIDESTRIKNSSAKRTKKILNMAILAPYRRIMSGAPVTQGVEDLFTQLKFLSEDILGFSSFYTFRNHFCITEQIYGAPVHAKRIIGYKNIDELKGRLDGHTYRVKKTDCLDLPEKVYVRHPVSLTKDQLKYYEELRENLIIELESGAEISTPYAITQLIKLQQIICGHIKDETGLTHDIKSNRVDEAIELVKEARGGVIIWARFKRDISLLVEAAKKADLIYVEYHGGINDEGRKKAIDKFTKGFADVFLGNPQAAGTGLNLMANCSTAIYYSNDFNADTRWQSEDRIHRIGQDNKCTYIDLVAANTIDDKVLGALLSKKNVAESIIDVRSALGEL